MGLAKSLFYRCILLLLVINYASAANILIWQALGTHSTRISMWPLIESLAERGHNVSFLSAYENIEKEHDKAKIHYILPRKWVEAQGPWEKDHSYFELRKNPWNIAKFFFDTRESGILACKVLYSDPEFLSWVKADSTKFDLIIVEYVWNECAYGLVHLWGTKLIIYGTTSVLPYMPDALGLPDESSSIGDMMFGFPSSRKNAMSFPQRFLNAFGPIVYHLTREWFYMPQLEEITRLAWGLKKGELPRFLDIEKNTSVAFVTSHYSLGPARSFPPNFIPVGGTVLSKHLKPIPNDMDQFIEGSQHGFIYISFGTVAEFTNFADKVQLEFIAALANFPHLHFIWKSTEQIKHPLPDNVFVAKWVSQQTILAHPKIKAFISHAGMGSLSEAIHYAVPVVTLPVLVDQNMNSELINVREAGIQLEVLTLKKEELVWAIKEILHNSKYRNGMQRLSKLFKDRPRPPLEEAVFWVEWVLRHDNVHEILMPPSVHQPWWKRRQIDVWITALVLSISLIAVITFYLWYLLKISWRKVFSTSRQACYRNDPKKRKQN